MKEQKPKEPEYLTVAEVKDLLRLNDEETVWDWYRKGYLPGGIKPTRNHLLFHRETLLGHLENLRNQADADD